MGSAQVIKYLRKKVSPPGEEPVEFEDHPIWLAPKLPFIKPLRNSNLHSLEEQYILGTDTYTEEYNTIDPQLEVEAHKIIKSFCKVPFNETPINQTNYYKLITYVYNEPKSEGEYNFSGDEFHIPYDPNNIMRGNSSDPEYPDEETLYFKSTTLYKKIDDSTIQIITSGNMIKQRDELYWVEDSEHEELIWEKKVIITYDDNNRELIQEKLISS